MIPQHERKILEAHVLGIKLSQLAMNERELNEYEKQQMKDLVKMRMKGVPLQYLTGNQDFFGREFYINTSVLVPRPETEGLVELLLKNLPPRDFGGGGNRFEGLELGTGSGCIALTIALERPDVRVHASDCSRDVLDVAEENARRFRVGNVEFMQVADDPLAWQYEDLPALDFVVSNPPYLVESDEVSAEVREHEPRAALFVPEHDPMMYYNVLSEICDAKLKSGGIAAFEIGEQRGEELKRIFKGAEIFKDLVGRDRYAIVRKD